MSELLACYVDGEPATHVSVQDRGLQYGDGVFTTATVTSGKPLLWEQHRRRLFGDAARLHMVSPAMALLDDEVARLCRGADRATLKVMLTRGAKGRGYRPSDTVPARRIMMLWARAPQTQWARDGVMLRLCRTRLGRNPALAGIKHLNRMEQVLARAEWGDDYAEGLMQDTAGVVVEGTMSNIFVVRAGELLTPDLHECGVRGVMRGRVLERARAINIASRDLSLSLAMVQDADEIFLTNSLIGIWPVRQFETKEYRIGPITRALQAAIVDDHDSV